MLAAYLFHKLAAEELEESDDFAQIFGPQDLLNVLGRLVGNQLADTLIFIFLKVFLYDQNKFMFIQPDENLSVYNTKAEKLYNFENHMLSDNNIGCIDENANVIFSKCLDNYEVKIHVSCIHTGKLLITYDDKVLGCNPELIVCMQMNKTNNSNMKVHKK